MSTTAERAAPDAPSPDAPRAQQARRTLPRPLWAWVALWLVVGTVLQVMRQPGVPSWDSIWAEDGGIFLTPALNDPFLQSVVTPYNGYLHVVPRLLAEVVAAFPLVLAAGLVAVLSALTVTLLSVYVFWASGAVLRSVWARAVITVLMTLASAAGIESTANLNNLHWFFMFAAFWACVAPPRRWTGSVLGALVVGTSALTDPLTALVLPLALLQLWRAAGGRAAGWRQAAVARSAVVVGTLLAALAAQALIAGSSAGRYAPSAWGDLPSIYGYRVVGSLLLGERPLSALPPPAATWVGYLLVLLTVAVLLAQAVAGDRPARTLLVTAAACSALFFTVPLMLRGTAFFLNEPGHLWGGARYTIIPALLLAVAFLVLLDQRAAAAPPGTWSWPQALVTLLLATVVVVNYANQPYRAEGPSWNAELTAAVADCRAGAAADGIARIPVAPIRVRGSSSVTLGCDQLLASAG